MHGHASDGLFWLYLSTVVRNNVTPVGFMHSKASCDFGNVVHVTCTLSQFFFFFFSRLYFAHFYDSTLVTCGAGLHRNGSTKELTDVKHFLSFVTRLSIRQWTSVLLAVVNIRCIRRPLSPLSTFLCRRHATTCGAPIIIHAVTSSKDGRY